MRPADDEEFDCICQGCYCGDPYECRCVPDRDCPYHIAEREREAEREADANVKWAERMAVVFGDAPDEQSKEPR